MISRFARERRVFFIEEPIVDTGPARLELSWRDAGVWVGAPHLPPGLDRREREAAQRSMVDRLIARHAIRSHFAWYYSPMALNFSRHLEPAVTIYDCMDQLSGFLGAPPELRERERELFERADLVFTGGHSLYEAKRGQHPAIYAFPSSIEVEHFGKARDNPPAPADQLRIGRPRVGYFGVIDERIDLELLAAIAELRSDWQFVMVGPVVKIDAGSLPRRANIHYLGQKSYADLPGYIAGWDVAMMPFARNSATQFISPTKTPEYLAAGCPVVSTTIRDVVRPYGEQGVVAIADEPGEFVAAIAAGLGRRAQAREHEQWLARVDAMLTGNSWNSTWARMRALIEAAAGEAERCSTT